jgi:AcrR family transcriptional regulator
MIRNRQQPSVEEVAQATGISKRTAYRYFKSREQLLADAALEGLRPKLDEILGSLNGEDAADRVGSLAEKLFDLTISYETELRTIARAALDASLQSSDAPQPKIRGRRRVDWVEGALKPVRGQLPKAAYERLVSAICVCVGMDAFLVLRDIRGLPDKNIKDTMVWMCRTLLEATLLQSKERR